MTQEEIRVGIVGANADVSWAKLSHVPAIKGLPGLRLAAVATRNEHSAGSGGSFWRRPLVFRSLRDDPR
jgi:predicted dehydrogenase